MVQTGSVPCVVLAQMLVWLHGKLYRGPNLSGVNQKDGFSTWMRFLSGLSCLTADPCAGVKWEEM